MPLKDYAMRDVKPQKDTVFNRSHKTEDAPLQKTQEPQLQTTIITGKWS